MSRVKIFVTVPVEYGERVRQAAGDAGAGRYEKYSYCSFSWRGVGRFLPLESAEPFIGEVGSLTEVEEEMVELVCEKSLAKGVIEAIRQAHPYETPTIDIVELVSEEDLG